MGFLFLFTISVFDISPLHNIQTLQNVLPMQTACSSALNVILKMNAGDLLHLKVRWRCFCFSTRQL